MTCRRARSSTPCSPKSTRSSWRPLRERLAKALEDAGGDTVEASATLRAAYREWRTQRADEVAGHLVLLAHGRGAFDAVPAGTPIHWVVDPEGPLCPDADDNALGGVIAAGEQFPTGHCHAPAHPGCRCGIAADPGLASPAVRVPSDLPREQAARSSAYVQPRSHRHHRRGGAGRRAVPVGARHRRLLHRQALVRRARTVRRLLGRHRRQARAGRHLHGPLRRAARPEPLDRRPPGAEGPAARAGGAVHRAVPADRRPAGVDVPHRRRPAVRSGRRRAGVEPVERLAAVHPQRAVRRRRTPSSASTSASTSSSCRS